MVMLPGKRDHPLPFRVRGITLFLLDVRSSFQQIRSATCLFMNRHHSLEAVKTLKVLKPLISDARRHLK
jgi:hypothetical protein